MTNRTIFLALLAPLTGIVGVEWTEAHNGALLGVVLAILTVILGIVVFAVRRQRTKTDDAEDTYAHDLYRLREAVPVAIYCYAVGADGVLRFGRNDPSPAFPLDWPPGGLLGRAVHDYIPAGPAGDEAREAYRRVIELRELASYVREDTDRHGNRAVIEYRHLPTADGGGICHAYALTPWAERAERAEAECARLGDENVRLRERLAQQIDQARTERKHRRTMAVLTGGTSGTESAHTTTEPETAHTTT